jgi:DNA-binding response OmpR family regulator
MKPRLLLIEDDDAVHCALSEVLQNDGYEVLHAFTPAEALLLAQTHDDIALVLLDLNLGGANGWDTFERLTTDNPLLPVIIITARSDQHIMANAAGAGALLEKPLHIPQLLEVIRGSIAELPGQRVARLAGRPPVPLHSSTSGHPAS